MRFLGILIAAVIIGLGLFLWASSADGNGGHGACGSGVTDIAPVNNDLATYNAGNDTITGVCVKAGNTSRHDYYTTDVNTGCYAISGIGTSVVTVTRLGEGRECQAISHIDVESRTPTSPTPTPTVSPTPTDTPTPTPTPPSPTTTPQSSPTVTPTVTLTPTTGTSTYMTPTALPNTGTGAVRDEGGTNWLSIALGLGLLAAGLGTLVYYARKGQ